ncbi:MAG: hypothetical protein NTV34_02385, partial [Proteobacteria bacterium]|nr:hypothetical protein [Pseudomonadota bacterium]
MQTEFPYLYGYLLIGILLAPMMTWTFFLKRSRVYLIAQVVAVVALIVGTLSPFKHAVIIWPLFCSLGAALFLKQEYLSIMSPASIAKSLPFAFSLVSATWLTFGLYDWGLLGYDKKFSFYAA